MHPTYQLSPGWPVRDSQFAFPRRSTVLLPERLFSATSSSCSPCSQLSADFPIHRSRKPFTSRVLVSTSNSPATASSPAAARITQSCCRPSSPRRSASTLPFPRTGRPPCTRTSCRTAPGSPRGPSWSGPPTPWAARRASGARTLSSSVRRGGSHRTEATGRNPRTSSPLSRYQHSSNAAVAFSCVGSVEVLQKEPRAPFGEVSRCA